ncbi:MAG: YihY/virulence factor BrkB family protein [Alphaproteobacteria bacterium]|nr:YihY/virulence factor BrkB family protein [Alphaproteobacteria bacterium]
MLSNIVLYSRALRLSVIGAIKENLLIYGGYAAYTSILAIFPFIIFLVALSSVLGNAELAEILIDKSFRVMPPEVVETLAPIIREIMENRDGTVLGFAAVGTLWVASSGIEGLRFGLNNMYKVREPRPLWKRRLQGVWFVLLCAFGFLIIATALIIWPLIETWLGSTLPFLNSGSLSFVRYSIAFLLLATGMSMMYFFLPNVKQRWREVYPGAFVASILWVGLASIFSYYIANFGNFATRYGSIAGVIITLVFLHFSASAMLFGGQFNAILKRVRNKQTGEKIKEIYDHEGNEIAEDEKSDSEMPPS